MTHDDYDDDVFVTEVDDDAAATATATAAADAERDYTPPDAGED
jgi:hypothetical protein